MDDAHINTINSIAAKLEKRQSADELLTVRQRRRQLNDRSASLSFSSSYNTGAPRWQTSSISHQLFVILF